MQIHHLQVEKVWENMLDSKTGRIVRRSTDQLQPATTSAITDEAGNEYRREPDGTFNVPGEVGSHYLKQDGWFAGENPFAEQLLAEHDEREQEAAAERAADEARAQKEADARKAEEAAEKAAAKKSPAK